MHALICLFVCLFVCCVNGRLGMQLFVCWVNVRLGMRRIYLFVGWINVSWDVLLVGLMYVVESV